MAMSSQIGRELCAKSGHRIETHTVADEILNIQEVLRSGAAPQIAHKRETLCVQCGLSLQDLRRLRSWTGKRGENEETEIEVTHATV